MRVCLFILGLHCRLRLDRQDRKVAPKGSVFVNLAAATATAGHGAGVVEAGSSNVHKVLSGASASALAAMAMSAAAGRDASSSSADAAMGAQQSPRFSGSSSSNAHGAAGGIVVASGGAHVPYTIISAPHRINKFKVPERVHAAAWEETETAAAAVQRDLTRLDHGNKAAAAEAAAAASLSPRPLHQRSPRPDSSSSTRSSGTQVVISTICTTGTVVLVTYY